MVIVKFAQKSGSVAIERFTGPQIRRFYKTHLDSYPQTKRIHLVSSFIGSILVGEDSPIDTGDGAGMNLMNIETSNWDPELIKATAPGLVEKLPSIQQGNYIVGNISNFFVKNYNFSPEAKVLIFTGDNPSSLVGMASSIPGKTAISLGTSDTYFAAMPETLSDPNGYGHVFGNPSGGSMSLQCFLNGSLAREKLKDKFNFPGINLMKQLRVLHLDQKIIVCYHFLVQKLAHYTMVMILFLKEQRVLKIGITQNLLLGHALKGNF